MVIEGFLARVTIDVQTNRQGQYFAELYIYITYIEIYSKY